MWQDIWSRMTIATLQRQMDTKSTKIHVTNPIYLMVPKKFRKDPNASRQMEEFNDTVQNIEDLG